MTLKLTHLPRGADEFNASANIGDDFDIIDFDQITLEDSTGNLHKVPDVSALLAQLKDDYKEWCERTGYWKSPAPKPLGNFPLPPTGSNEGLAGPTA